MAIFPGNWHLDHAKKIKKMKSPSIPSLFFLHRRRNKKYYAWWEVESEEAIIHKYVKID